MEADVMNDYFSEKKAARDLGVTVPTLRNWAAKREGPARTKIGRRIFYRKDALSQWLLDQEQDSGAAFLVIGVGSRPAGNGHATNGQGAGV